MEILICQRPQIVSGDYLMNFHPFGACNGSLESSNPTLFNHMSTSHFNTSYSIRSCSFLSKSFLLILTGSIASKGITIVQQVTPRFYFDMRHCPFEGLNSKLGWNFRWNLFFSISKFPRFKFFWDSIGIRSSVICLWPLPDQVQRNLKLPIWIPCCSHNDMKHSVFPHLFHVFSHFSH